MSLSFRGKLYEPSLLDVSTDNFAVTKQPATFPSKLRQTSKSKDFEMSLFSTEFATGIQMGRSSMRSPTHVENEDRACYEISSLSCDNDAPISGYAAVFDGHGGNKCSEYVSNVVGTHIRENYCDDDAWQNGEEVMREIFHKIDKEYQEIALSRREYSGACATIVVIREDEAIVGNIGDCRAIIVPIAPNGGYSAPVEVTVDHRADCTSENLRINEAGGEVHNGRIHSLQPSRSFGDFDVKQVAGEDVVIASPDVDRVYIHKTPRKKKSKGSFISKFSKGSEEAKKDNSRAFMVVATDGVWDVLSNVQVANCIKQTLGVKTGMSSMKRLLGSRREYTSYDSFEHANMAQVCAEKLVNLAKEKGSDDDITAVVILF